MTTTASAWVSRPQHPRSQSHVQLRLFCLPYAGGSAHTYATWANRLPATIEVWPVHLPGRAERLRDTPLESATDVVAALAPVIQPFTDVPYAIFGHSMGTLVAYELAQQLRRNDVPAPQALFVSGRRSVHFGEAYPAIRHLDDDAFITALHQRYGRLTAILTNTAIQELLLPALRADFSICETYAPSTLTPLPYAIYAYGGTEDRDARLEDLLSWSRYTTDRFQVTMVPGGHFFIEDHPELLIAALTRDVHALMPMTHRSQPNHHRGSDY